MKKKKKIAVIGLKGLPAFGGAATVGENLIAQLKDDYDFTVLSISSHTDLKTGEYNGVKQVVFKSFLGKGGLNTAWYYFVSMLYVLIHKFDLVHLHHMATGFIIPIIRLKNKTVLTIHGCAKKPDPKYGKILNDLAVISKRISMKSASKILAVSLDDKEYLSNLYMREIEYIPNGVNIIQSIDKDLNDPYILFAAGRIFDRKGLHFLLEAANNLHLKKKIKVAGDMDRVLSYKAVIKQSIKELDVEMLGLIKDKSELMRIVNNAELFVFPSLYEAMSMMLLEVASMKTPIIASDIPANTNVFSDDEVLFFKSGDSEDLTQKLEYALANKDDMKERAEKAYTKLIDNYTWDKIARQYIDIYEQI